MLSTSFCRILSKVKVAIFPSAILALSCLISASPAKAGHWKTDPTYSGTRTASGFYLLRDPQSGSESWKPAGASSPNFFAQSSDETASVRTAGSITTTWTWVYDDPDDPDRATNDPPPANVLLEESGNATITMINKTGQLPNEPKPGEHSQTGDATMGDIPLVAYEGGKSGTHYVPKYSSSGGYGLLSGFR